MNRQRCWSVLFCGFLCVNTFGNDWPSWRGPEHQGISRERAIVTHWSQGGENLLWKVPVGGRTTPIVMRNRLYAITPVGEGSCRQERVICLDASSGKTIWEHRFNVFHTDIVENRVGWTSVVGDPRTGYIYAHGTGGEFFCFDRDGNIIWKWSLTEELGRSSGYGGRLHTPIIDENRVILSTVYILSRWGTGKQKAGHRYYAFDKLTGRIIWAAQPGGRPLDTTYSVPVVTVIGGRRMIIAGNADGNVYAMLSRTGETVWKYRLSKRGINSSIVVDGDYAYVSHSEENIIGTEMGSLVCIDATKFGDITDTGMVWRVDGLKAGYSSPAIIKDRLYIAANSGQLHCYDSKTGKLFWQYDLGTVMKGSPVITQDGVIYVGEVNGHFHILKDQQDHCESLDYKELTRPDGAIVEILGSPAIAGGRVFFMTRYDTYCLGVPNQPNKMFLKAVMDKESGLFNKDGSMRKFKPRLLLVPNEITVTSGEGFSFDVHLYDELGQLISDQVFRGAGSPDSSQSLTWNVEGVDGTVTDNGFFEASSKKKFSAGTVTITMGENEVISRVRVVPELPIYENFDDLKPGTQPPGWIGVDAKTKLVEKDGSMVLQKLALKPSAKYARMRSFSGPPIKNGYTVQVDLLGSPKEGRRKTLSDMGLINTRYNMILLGREKRIRLVSWAPMPRVQKEVDFDWQPDVWYRTKLRVDVEDHQSVVRGKVWLRDQDEPTDWMIKMIDTCPNREGSPGLYAYSKGTSAKRHGASVFFDNYRVMKNE